MTSFRAKEMMQHCRIYLRAISLVVQQVIKDYRKAKQLISTSERQVRLRPCHTAVLRRHIAGRYSLSVLDARTPGLESLRDQRDAVQTMSHDRRRVLITLPRGTKEMMRPCLIYLHAISLVRLQVYRKVWEEVVSLIAALRLQLLSAMTEDSTEPCAPARRRHTKEIACR